MRRKIATMLTLLALAAAGSALTACNTIHGMGQDVSAAGHAVTGTAERAQSH